ncbi:DUF5689 domain-containing protein [Lutibacter sp. TH_r2]|uniref:DUF5689 domain-containing protein n=1 Tax=Lutibacter sp. TH_r2 TaxID=3082083 RepID=UPI002954F070|nr:DUF5689 domain-containing protein [Lutibacter sp. TH_r2]MDV7186372.1 DUF5689 domain-containing protein [Lutibacter sp. TH_r2]
MKNRYKNSALLIIIALMAISCVKDSDFSTPNVECVEQSLTVTNTLSQIKDMYAFGGTQFETDIIIEGYVVSSDQSGNIYKSLSIQDKPENPTAAIKIAIDQTDIYTKFEVGRKIYIKLNGLAIDYSYGSLQIGKISNSELEGISTFELDNHIIRSCEVATIVPKKVAIADLTEDMLEMLIELENVQFAAEEIGDSYANVDNTTTVNRKLQSFDASCNLTGEVEVRNSGYADFKNELLPEGKGSVIAIFSNYYDDFQLYLRGTYDVNLTETRCSYSNALTPNITLAEVKDMYAGSVVEFGVSNNYIVQGYVISSDEDGNFNERLIIQDAVENPTTGIQILVESDAIYENYNVGDKIFVNLDKLYMDEVDGALTIGYGSSIDEIDEEDFNTYIINSGENTTIVPTEITIVDVDSEMYKNTLVTVQNVQLVETELGKAFADFSGTADGIRTLETCGESKKLGVYTNGDATFANELFPEGHGSVIGVLGETLEVRTIDDVDFNEAFEVCPVIIPKIMITEVADPNNDVSARFVELYNAGDSEIDLTGWKLNKYVNGATAPSSGGYDLTGYSIAVGDFLIIANTGFSAAFALTPDIETTYMSANGDDSYELVDNAGVTMDMYGVIGEDGNGTNWEFEDGRAVRNITVVEPNATFTSSEWTIYSDTNNTLISNPNTPQNAPDDFNPYER